MKIHHNAYLPCRWSRLTNHMIRIEIESPRIVEVSWYGSVIIVDDLFKSLKIVVVLAPNTCHLTY
jgi:hypothetical protein